MDFKENLIENLDCNAGEHGRAPATSNMVDDHVVPAEPDQYDAAGILIRPVVLIE